MPYSVALREEELKLHIAKDFFSGFDTTPIIGNIDFCVAVAAEQNTLFNMAEDPTFIESILWAEAKKGVKSESGMYESLVQLILTVGKARTFDRYLPPVFLGAFDAEKIAFIPYEKIMPVFSQNDFNWNVTPSNHETKEFIQLYTTVKEILESEMFIFTFDNAELKNFIKENFVLGNRDSNRVGINKNNFVTIYGKWSEIVKPSIRLDWDAIKKYGIIDADFFLADLLSSENTTIIEKLYVLLKSNHYELDRKVDAMGFEESKRVTFNDNQKAHKKFWSRYNRPPKEEYWDYIVERRDLLVPQDVRERKGSFFTPKKWVELSQKYIADVLGENWQDEYYIWDCAAGTGNLLAGLTNKYKIWASTLDKADVEVMKERIANGANLLENHVFQFDFLNDDLQGEKVPESLRKILADENERKKLVIYINPPYAEAGNKKAISNEAIGNKEKVARENKVFEKYGNILGTAANELFAQFFIRIYCEIRGCHLAEFSTLKLLQAPFFMKFRDVFLAKLKKMFIVPANSFDNVKGEFPIGFFIWDTNIVEKFSEINVDVFDLSAKYIQSKLIFEPPKNKLWMDWVKTFHDKNGEKIGYLRTTCSDFQNQNGTFILSEPSANDILQKRTHEITKNNFLKIATAYAVRQCIEATWLNDRDQFLYPKDTWQTDFEFQADCLTYTLFHGQNRISVIDNGKLKIDSSNSQFSTINSQLTN